MFQHPPCFSMKIFMWEKRILKTRRVILKFWWSTLKVNNMEESLKFFFVRDPNGLKIQFVENM